MTGWNSQFYLFEGLGNNSPLAPLTRVIRRYKHYYPTVNLITPQM